MQLLDLNLTRFMKASLNTIIKKLGFSLDFTEIIRPLNNFGVPTSFNFLELLSGFNNRVQSSMYPIITLFVWLSIIEYYIYLLLYLVVVSLISLP